MTNKIVSFVAHHAGKERSTTIKIVSLVMGIFTFFFLVPIALGIFGHLVASYGMINVPRIVELTLGIVSMIFGLSFLLWSVSAFWFIGKGTPVPFASPTRLVTSGPFRYTRNPIKLGAVSFYFGVGCFYDSFATGFVMLVTGAILGSIYHKCVEEKELVIRFGNKYEEYRKRTSFLIPLQPKG